MTVKFEIPDELYHRAVAAAARLGITLDELIVLSLERRLAVQEAPQRTTSN